MKTRRLRYLRAFLLSFAASAFSSFVAWSVLDYMTYYGGYDRTVRAEINAFHQLLTINLSSMNGDEKIKEFVDQIQLPIGVDLVVRDTNASNAAIADRTNKSRWDFNCCKDHFQQSIINRKYNKYVFSYSYYIIPTFSTSFLHTISFSFFPNYFHDKTFSFKKWRSNLADYNWQKSVMFYMMFWLSFVVFIYWNIRNRPPEEELESYELRLASETEKLKTSSEQFKAAIENLQQINSAIAKKQLELASRENRDRQDRKEYRDRKDHKDRKKRSSAETDRLKKEVSELESERQKLERNVMALNENIAATSDDIQESENNAKIINIKIQFMRLFGGCMPNSLIEQMAESMFLYEQNPEYISQIMHTWFNGFDYIIKKHAAPYRSKDKKYLLLGDAINILRNKFLPSEIDYYELKAIVSMRNRFSHFESDILSLDNLRMLKTKLFGYKNTDGIFYKLTQLYNNG